MKNRQANAKRSIVRKGMVFCIVGVMALSMAACGGHKKRGAAGVSKTQATATTQKKSSGSTAAQSGKKSSGSTAAQSGKKSSGSTAMQSGKKSSGSTVTQSGENSGSKTTQTDAGKDKKVDFSSQSTSTARKNTTAGRNQDTQKEVSVQVKKKKTGKKNRKNTKKKNKKKDRKKGTGSSIKKR